MSKRTIMKKLFYVFAVFTLSINFVLGQNAPEDKKWEEQFKSIPDPVNLRAYMERLTARPHHLGSAYDKDNAEWILAQFKAWGLDAEIEKFEVLFPSPKERLVEMIEPVQFTAKLKEPKVAEDPTSSQFDEQLPTYNAYSADGDVTGELVFVNYGIPADYDYLERRGISVKGKIVIAKYGGSWRGIKPKVAAEHGAIGCLIYSDPQGDGYFQGDEYPGGPWRTADGVQRGSVMDMPLYPGDPLTPGVGATKNAKRLKREDVEVFTKIPVLPLSHADAQPLLAALAGPVAPHKWSGNLPMTYHLGPGPTKVRLKVAANWEMKTIYNVIAKIPGSEFPDEWIIRGNHHDAWVNGAADPISGLVALMEEARGLSELLKQGWKPKRTLIYCAWDAEEQGLIGSTEWVETHAAELKQKAALYINTDASLRGYIDFGGSHTLEKFINAVAKDIEDPETGLTVWKRRQLLEIAEAQGAKQLGELRQKPELKIAALGSGSDYTAFLDHLGIASLNLGYFGEGGYGVYHSIYDSFHWYTNFGDPDFIYCKALAQTAGLAVMRFATADILPYDFTNFSSTISTYVDELKKLATDMREKISETNQQIEDGVFAAIADPKDYALAAPKREIVPPFFNFAPLENAVDALQRSANDYTEKLTAFRESGQAIPVDLNKKLLQNERKLTHEEGLPDRQWFKHHIYAPGFYTGYGVKTLPRVREAIEQKKWDTVDQQIEKTAAVINGFSDYIGSISQELEKGQE
ncbi:MAG: M28 family metallopeptidase [Deferribacteres bacterium]|nr:M28 family metallopeptidase [candidate division KSB1 bacterium]MCB9500661.1 M28 family metallopeptidase [Deferribacteres bacterium]